MFLQRQLRGASACSEAGFPWVDFIFSHVSFEKGVKKSSNEVSKNQFSKKKSSFTVYIKVGYIYLLFLGGRGQDCKKLRAKCQKWLREKLGKKLTM